MVRPLLLVLLCLGTSVMSQDYEREARWRSEVLGNLVVGDAVQIAGPTGRKFLGLHAEGAKGKPAIVLVHGLGVHPDHGVIGMLRVALNDMGFTTLSIQMPVLAADAAGEAYEPLVPEAVARIATAAGWLGGKGHERIVLASHSLGSRFALETAKTGGFAAWICLGRGGDLGDAEALRQPVLDVYGEKDNAAVLASAPARRAALERIPGSRQAVIPGADHFYNGKEEALARVLREFIEALPAR
jgi:pimeloyl-ACP methyl ester carboxylesterase